MDNKKCTICNKEIDKDIYKKDKNLCKNGYNINRKNYKKTRSLELITIKRKEKLLSL